MRCWNSGVPTVAKLKLRQCPSREAADLRLVAAGRGKMTTADFFFWTQGDAPDEASTEISQRAVPVMDRYTLPFLWIEDAEAGAVGQYGSGVLLEVSGRHFLLTAAHTLDEVLVTDRPTYFPADGENPVLPFGERRCVTTLMPET